MPIWLSYEVTGFYNLPDWVDEITMIEVMEFIDIVSCISSIVNLAVISIDRFFGIVTPLKHKALMSEKAAIGCICGTWFYSFVIAGVKFVPRFRNYIVFNFVAGYAVPLLIICCSYTFIFMKVKQHANHKVRSNQLFKQWTLARTISIVIFMLFICWTPFYLIVLLYQYCFSCTFFDQPWFEHIPGIIKALHYFNSCCNPFVYGVFNVNFRSAYKGILYKCLGKEMKPNPYDISVIVGSRNASIRNRSNTSVSVLSYMEPQSSACPEADEFMGLGTDRVRTSSFSKIGGVLPKPLSPKRLEDQPRLLLRQKFQKQASLEQHSPILKEMVAEEERFLRKSRDESYSSDEDEYERDTSTQQSCYVDSFQNSTLLDIDNILSQARESDI